LYFSSFTCAFVIPPKWDTGMIAFALLHTSNFFQWGAQTEDRIG
jgi:hypothetical protein